MSTAEMMPITPRAAHHVGAIGDRYEAVLGLLAPAQRRRYELWLTHGFYDGWRPSRSELTDEIAVDLALISWTEARERRRKRRLGHQVQDLLPRVRERMRRRAR